jgi:hypothetical protein
VLKEQNLRERQDAATYEGGVRRESPMIPEFIKSEV